MRVISTGRPSAHEHRRSRPAPALLERDDTLAVLRELLAGVRSGREGRLVLIGGEAGLGEIAVLRTFAATQSATSRVLWGACEPLRTPHPLGALFDAAESTGGRLQELVNTAARPHEVASAC